MSNSKFSESKTHSRHNYLNTQKSNAHTKVNKQLVQLWFGSVTTASNLLDSSSLKAFGMKHLNSDLQQHFKALSKPLNADRSAILPSKPLLLALCMSAFSTNAFALSQPVSSIATYTQASTESSYVGANDGLTYNWGTGTETVLDTLTTVNGIYAPSVVADNVVINRVDNANVTGTRCRLFAERTTNNQSLAASHSCDAAAIMSGRVINRGWLDVFANDPEDGNIERVDFLYTQGLTAPTALSDLQNSGHIVTEKSGNNPVVMAAITEVDGNGTPTAYAPLVKIWPSSSAEAIRYGIIPGSVDFSFLSDGATPATQNGEPEGVGTSSEPLGIALVTLDDLGIAQNQTYYGFSYFSQDIYDASTANKVIAGLDPVDYASFPTNTSGSGAVGDADMYGGVASYFSLQKTLSGKAFDNQNVDLANITVDLYADSNGNGQLDSGEALVASTETDGSGNYSFNVGSNADYLVVIDNADTDVPAGMAASTSTLVVSVESSNVANQDFPFTPVNDAPVGVDDTVSTNEETLVNIPVVSNDTDTDAGDTLTPTNITAPSNGTAVLNADGETIDYTPNASFTGTDTFTYTPNDSTVDGAVVTVTVTVDPVNDAPVGVDDTVSTNEETLVNIPVVSNDTDADAGDTLTPTNITAPSDGTAVLNVDGETIDYTPNASFTGTDTFTYTPNDGTVNGAVVTVTVTVDSVNDAPVGIDDTASTNEETLVNIPVVSNDTDTDAGDTLIPTNITAPSNGTAVLNADGETIDYTPNANFTGTDTFTYTPNDGTVNGAVVTVTVTVDPVNDAPVGVDDTASTNEETLVNIPVVSNDTDADTGDTLTPTNITAPSNGTAVLNADGVTIDYTPNANFTGTDTFTYTPNDGTVDGAVVTVTVTVDSVNDTPVGVDDTASTNEEALVNIPVVSNDTDADAGDTLTPTNITAPGDGTAVLNVDGVTIDYTPNANFTGTDTFTYTPNDGTVDGAVVIVTVTVDPVNDVPVGVDDTASTNEETLVNIPVVSNDTDADAGDTLTPTNITAPSNGTAVLNADGVTIDYTPNANFTGTDTFTYTPNDGTTDGEVVTVTVTVDPVNDAPVATDDGTFTVVPLVTQNHVVLTNDTDVDANDTLTITHIIDPANPATPLAIVTGTPVTLTSGTVVELLANGSLNITPAATTSVTESFDYTISDNNGGKDTATVTIAIDTDADGIVDSIDIDDDNDGITDIVEQAGNPTRDTDEDGILDRLDLDADNDGILDITEAGGTDTNSDGVVDDAADADNDGLADVVDLHPDTADTPTDVTTGLASSSLPTADTDADGKPDFQDVDSDNDGISDLIEGDTDPALDSDNDGAIDSVTLPVDANGIATTTPSTTPDTDVDGIPDYRDLDSDNDGLNDVVEAGGDDIDADGIIDVAGELVNPAAIPDEDNDGLVDPLEPNNPDLPETLDADGNGVIDDTTDTDGDGVPDGVDGNLNGFGDEADNDHDGITDAIDLDDDNDGIPDTVEAASARNNGDTDGDGIKDSFDTDADGDGINDLYESGQPETLLATLDTNDDGVIDTPVGANGLSDDLESNDSATAILTLPALPRDTDGDSQPNFQDIDSDGDSVPDSLEGENHGVSGLEPDTDGDGAPDYLDFDSDNDGIPDVVESSATGNDTDNDGIDDAFDTDTNPGFDSDSDGVNDDALPDTDNDGSPDMRDLDSDKDGLPDTIEGDVSHLDTDFDGIDDAYDADATNGTDANSDGVDDNAAPDTDGDTTADFREKDSDADGIPDTFEGDATGTDTDGDGLDDRFDVDVTGGADNNNDGIDDVVSPADTDTDGKPDYRDLDSDKDGILDSVEADVTATDEDNDGIDGLYDVDVTGGDDLNGDGIDDGVSPINTDTDLNPDYRDLDSDNDSIPDVTEAGNQDDNFDGLHDEGGTTSATLPNVDGDSLPDYRDTDSNNDGENDIDEAGSGGLDTNDDGMVDDIGDSDNDGIPNIMDGEVGQFGTSTDSDNDGVANSTDLDDDNDGIPDIAELDTSGRDVDTDGDGMVDRLDRDSDNDGIPDTIEATRDSVNRDANLDGLVDGFTDQNQDGLHDLVLPSYTPVNTDSLDQPDFRDLDSDNDTLSDHLEASGGIALDPNADGVIDVFVDTDLDGLADSVDPDAPGLGNAGKALVNPDFDKDGARNFRDLDSDNDELVDSLEAGDPALNPAGQDTNGNGAPNFLDTSGALETAVTGKAGNVGLFGLFMLLLLGLRKRLGNGIHGAWGAKGAKGVKGLSRFLPMLMLAVVMMSSSDNAVAGVVSQQVAETETSSEDTSYADRDSMEQAFESSFYGGIGGVYSHVDPEGEANGWRTSKDGNYDAGYQLFAGYHFKPNWFAELGYTDMGKAELDNRIDPRLGNESISYKVPSLHLGYLLRDHDKEVNVYGKAGVSVIRNKASARRVPYQRQTSTQLSGGAGVQYQPKETNWFARAGVDVHDRDAVALGLSVGYKFKPVKQEVEEESFPITAPEPAPKPVQVAQVQPRPKPVPRPRPIDSDGDGFIDSIDDCIHSRRDVVVDGKGCEVKPAKPVFNYVLRGVNFHTDSARLTSDSMHILDDVANTLSQHPQIKVQIVGHTDDRGKKGYNQGLSERRAASVVSYMVSQGINSSRISSAGRGETQPIATNSTALGRGTNRRVEIREVK